MKIWKKYNKKQMKVNMNKLDLERCKKDKEEYDKKVRSLDYKIVETSVSLYNSGWRNSQNNLEDEESSKVKELKLKIQQYEKEKEDLTKEFWEKLVVIKTNFSNLINKKIEKFPKKRAELLLASFAMNKITDVYFDANELVNLSYLFDDDKTSQNAKLEVKNNTVEEEKQPSVLIPVKEEKEIAIPFKPTVDIKQSTTGAEENLVEKQVETMATNTDQTLDVNKPKPETSKEEKKEAEITNVIKTEDKDEPKREPIYQEQNVPKPAAVTIERPFEVEEKFKPAQPVPQFNIEEQRIVDFENLLNHIYKISKDYRIDVERALSRFIINYKIVKNTQYLKNDFDNLTNNYLDMFKTTFLKFKKDESLDALQERIENQENATKDIEKKLLNNNIEIKEMLRQMKELSKVYFVGGYVRKVLNQVAKIQGEQEVEKTDKEEKTNNVFVPIKDSTTDNTNDVFQKIKKLAYDKRMSHIIEVSKWTKNVEEKLTMFQLEESDFQFVIYLIRQTENVCNSNFEQVANIIISLCDANQQLEVVEKNENEKNKELQEEINTTEILKSGIENIKKKYSKVPFIGRKVSSILSAKMLNE